ncbi:MAG: hypothetical protein WBG54_21490 [Acidobacteriaceae bacterium]
MPTSNETVIAAGSHLQLMSPMTIDALPPGEEGSESSLEQDDQQNDIAEWLIWFAEIALEAQRRSIALVEFIIPKSKLLDRLRGKMNERQRKVLLRMFRVLHLAMPSSSQCTVERLCNSEGAIANCLVPD